MRAPRPSAAQWRWLALTALGVVFGFPLFMGLAVQRVDAMHAVGRHRRAAAGDRGARGVAAGPAPARAVLGLRRARLRAGAGVRLAARRRGAAARRWPAARWRCCSVRSAMSWGARLSASMRPEHVIWWVLVLSLAAHAAAGVVRRGRRAPVQACVVGRLRLRGAVFDVARLLRVVPWPGAGRHGAREPGAAAAAVPVDPRGRAAARRDASMRPPACSCWP